MRVKTGVLYESVFDTKGNLVGVRELGPAPSPTLASRTPRPDTTRSGTGRDGRTDGRPFVLGQINLSIGQNAGGRPSTTLAGYKARLDVLSAFVSKNR